MCDYVLQCADLHIIWYARDHSRFTGSHPHVPFAWRHGRPLIGHCLRNVRKFLCSQVQEPCTGLYSGMYNMLALSIIMVTHISTYCNTACAEKRTWPKAALACTVLRQSSQ